MPIADLVEHLRRTATTDENDFAAGVPSTATVCLAAGTILTLVAPTPRRLVAGRSQLIVASCATLTVAIPPGGVEIFQAGIPRPLGPVRFEPSCKLNFLGPVAFLLMSGGCSCDLYRREAIEPKRPNRPNCGVICPARLVPARSNAR